MTLKIQKCDDQARIKKDLYLEIMENISQFPELSISPVKDFPSAKEFANLSKR